MNESFWHEKAMYERRAKLLLEAQKGNSSAGKKILSTALEALAKVICGEHPDRAQLATLDYLRTALHDYLLKGIPIERALLIERRDGRPILSDFEKIQVFCRVKARIEELKSRGSHAPTKEAQNDIAKQLNMSPRNVRAIWQNESIKRLNKNENY